MVNQPLTTKSEDSVKINGSLKDKQSIPKKEIFMKAIALAALAFPMVAAPALAGPYVMTKSEFKFTDENYKEAVNQARLGYETKAGNFTPYIEVGGGLKTPEGKDSTGLTAAEVGTGIKITKQLSAKAKIEAINAKSKTDWKVEVGTKYKF